MAANASPTSHPSNGRLIAPVWHTIVFIIIFVGLAVVGGFFQHAVNEHPHAAARSANAVPGYLSVIISEWLLVLYVRMGVQKRGVGLRDLVGGRWATPADVLKDIIVAAGIWALWIGLMNSHMLGGGTNAARGLLPQGILERVVWIPLAFSAGICEELAFRGYLQKQFHAMTGSVGLAVLIQAIIFGVGHLYEGVGPVLRIMLFAVLFGLLAVWRKSLRPGMIAHTWADIFGVVIFPGLG
ncbi:MAG TPA: CPBP family intramembrane glutamic endopeptidase [Candidatus Dormibacteraeota bacterium]|nr:CPBP family intramembrane glutamic endopeptidase [Candidatus Dormibacteraeota bacterium]